MRFRSDAQPVPGEYGKRAAHLRSVRFNTKAHQLRLLLSDEPLKAQQQNARVQAVLTKDQLAEVLVSRDQESSKPIGVREHLLIGDARR